MQKLSILLRNHVLARLGDVFYLPRISVIILENNYEYVKLARMSCLKYKFIKLQYKKMKTRQLSDDFV